MNDSRNRTNTFNSYDYIPNSPCFVKLFPLKWVRRIWHNIKKKTPSDWSVYLLLFPCRLDFVLKLEGEEIKTRVRVDQLTTSTVFPRLSGRMDEEYLSAWKSLSLFYHELRVLFIKFQWLQKREWSGKISDFQFKRILCWECLNCIPCHSSWKVWWSWKQANLLRYF